MLSKCRAKSPAVISCVSMGCLTLFKSLLILASLGLFDIALSLDGRRTDDTAFDRTETRGNVSFRCSSSGPCTPCTYTEKNDDEKYHCSNSGYRESYKCVEVPSSGLNGETSQEHRINQEHEQLGGSSSKKKSERVLQASEHIQEGHTNAVELNAVEGRKVFEEDVTTHDGRQVFYVFYSCVPTDTNERLTVLGFEGLMLGLLAMSAPLIYHRRKRSFALSGMTRLPTNARF